MDVENEHFEDDFLEETDKETDDKKNVEMEEYMEHS